MWAVVILVHARVHHERNAAPWAQAAENSKSPKPRRVSRFLIHHCRDGISAAWAVHYDRIVIDLPVLNPKSDFILHGIGHHRHNWRRRRGHHNDRLLCSIDIIHLLSISGMHLRRSEILLNSLESRNLVGISLLYGLTDRDTSRRLLLILRSLLVLKLVIMLSLHFQLNDYQN